MTPITLPHADGDRIDQRDDIHRLSCIIRRYGNAAPAGLVKMLVAVDGSAVSLALATRVIEWQQKLNWASDVHLLLVQDFLGKEAAERNLEKAALADTEAVRQRLQDAGIGFCLHILMGDPAQRIIERAACLDAALILMGTRGHGPLSSVLLGSVAYKVVHESIRPVTLLRA